MKLLDQDPRMDWVPTEVFNWDRKETNVLVLNYTLSCPLACDFCCYGCSPKKDEKMSINFALDLIDQANKLGVFSSVGFTGGEAMIYYDEILKIADRLKSYNFSFTIATAGHWAKSQKEAENILEPLAKRGLKRINLSHDPSHARFVPKENIINAAKSSSLLGIPTYIVGTFFSNNQSLDTYIPELVGIPKVALINKYVAKVGRAKDRNLTQDTYGLRLSLEDLSCYRRVYHDLVVFYDGETYPCCSTFNRATKGISLGNAYRETLKDLWYKAEGSLLLRNMKRIGFSRIYSIIKTLDPDLFKELPSIDQCLGPCSLCHMIFNNNDLSERIKNLFKEYEKIQITKSIDNLSQLMGSNKIANVLSDSLIK